MFYLAAEPDISKRSAGLTSQEGRSEGLLKLHCSSSYRVKEY